MKVFNVDIVSDRVSASTNMGKSEIINIEREVGFSENSHAKGVFILTGYFRGKYGSIYSSHI